MLSFLPVLILNSIVFISSVLKRFQDENDEDTMINEWWDFYKKSKIDYNFLGKYSKSASADMTG